jgi:hypothetical protein
MKEQSMNTEKFSLTVKATLISTLLISCSTQPFKETPAQANTSGQIKEITCEDPYRYPLLTRAVGVVLYDKFIAPGWSACFVNGKAWRSPGAAILICPVIYPFFAAYAGIAILGGAVVFMPTFDALYALFRPPYTCPTELTPPKP